MTFAERVYAIVRRIPKGKVTTYKEIGLEMNSRGYRAIGQALRCNPYAPVVPCHRVVASDGSIGGFMGSRAAREIENKKRMLNEEGVVIMDGRIDLGKYLYKSSKI